MSGIFPQDSTYEGGSIVIRNVVPQYGKTYIFDFEKGEFKKTDGKVYVGEGIECLKNWIEKTLRTERYRFPIYSFDYGITLEELLTKDIPYDALVNEAKNQITDALMQDRRIAQVGNFYFDRKGTYLSVQFEVKTFDRNTISMEVKV